MRLVVLLLLCPALALGACRGSPDDRWRGDDKVWHLGAGAVTAVVIGTHASSPWTGFALSAGLWTAYEFADRPFGGVCSYKDAAAGILGAAIGAAASGYFVTLRPGGGIYVQRTWELK